MSEYVSLGSEFAVNSTTSGNQVNPKFAAFSDGQVIATWIDTSGSYDGSGNAIVGQILARDGSKIGSEFLVNNETAGSQYNQSVAVLNTGTFVVAWITNDETQDGSGNAVKARRFDSDGNPLADEFLVNTSTASSQFTANVVALSNGGFVVGWDDWNGFDQKAQVYSFLGAKVGNEITVNTNTAANQEYGALAALDGGGFVSVWRTADSTADGDGQAIKALLFDNAGTKVGNEFLVNSEAAGNQNTPAAAGLENGNFVVVWETFDATQDGDATALKAQVFTATGAKVGGEFLINQQATNMQRDPSLTALSDGGFLVSWTTFDTAQDGSSAAVKARFFDADGTPRGDEFLVNSVTAGSQSNPDVVEQDANTLIVSWQSTPAADSDVKAQIYNFGEINGSVGNDNLLGTTGDDTIIGLAGNDVINGSSGQDRIYGGDGDDTIIGAAGSDWMDGGAGIDTLSYANADSGVTILLFNSVAMGGHADNDVFLNFENIRGSAFDDVLIGDDTPNLLIGGPGNDVLGGGGDDDMLEGQQGDDLFPADDGADFLNGGAGIDTVDYGNSNEAVQVAIGGVSTGGQAEGDFLYAIENVIGSGMDDTITGSNLDNMLTGASGNDTLNGASGADTLYGSDGDDILNGGPGGDLLDGGGQTDTATYFSSNVGVWIDLAAGTASLGHAAGDTLVSIENLIGSNTGNDRLYGNAGTNVLEGFGGSDWLRGGGGNDIIRLGDDTVQDRAIYDADNFGNDFVGQFHDEEDILDMRGLGLTFDDVNATQVGNTTTLTFAGITGQITLTQFYAADITASDFFF